MPRASGSDDERAVAVFGIIRQELGIWILDSVTALNQVDFD
jgi:hypothetical protein